MILEFNLEKKKIFLITKANFLFFVLDFPSTRLELEAVADIFDLDKDGYIDYKEFLATLKPTAVNFFMPFFLDCF